MGRRISNPSQTQFGPDWASNSRLLSKSLGEGMGKAAPLAMFKYSRLKWSSVSIPTKTLHDINQYNTMFSITYNQGSAGIFKDKLVETG